MSKGAVQGDILVDAVDRAGPAATNAASALRCAPEGRRE
jgi:hypothetical protein